jgi:hypothetical protein
MGFGPFLIFAAFVLANLGWVTVAEMRSTRERRLNSLVAPLLALVGWAAAFVFDGLHHGS